MLNLNIEITFLPFNLFNYKTIYVKPKRVNTPCGSLTIVIVKQYMLNLNIDGIYFGDDTYYCKTIYVKSKHV